MKKRNPKRPPIRIIRTFGYVTKEKFDALPDPVKDKLGRGIYAFFMKLAEKEAAERSIGMAA